MTNYNLMKVTNLTQCPNWHWCKLLLFKVLLLSQALPSFSQNPCDPAAEFTYSASSYCQNGSDPTPSHSTGSDGTYTYMVVSGGPTLSLNAGSGLIDLSASSPGTYDVTNTVNTMSNGPMVIVGVVDGPLTGGTPKAMELYVLENIPSLSAYSISVYFNGNTTAGAAFTFPNVPATAGTRIWIATEIPNFTAYFGFPPTYTSNVVNINGDDAFRLFQGATVVDQFGQVGVDGTGTFWDYLDGWAYRANNTGPDGNTFPQANWIFSGIDALDGTMTNASAMNPWPIGQHINILAASVSCTRQVQIVAPPFADAGPNQLVCEGEVVSLAASGSGSWSGGVGTFSNVNSPTSTYTPASSEIGTSVLLTWTVPSTGGVCVSATDIVAITILEEADAEFSYPSSLFCPNGTTNPAPTHSTGTDGLYTYGVINGGPFLDLNPATGVINLAGSDVGTYGVTNGVSGCGNLIITGVVDGPLTGGIPKAVEFYALTDIPDLSAYGFGSANNGGGSDGQEFTFPATSIAAGTHIWVATEATAFQAFFGFPPTFVNANAPSINGDDAIELFCNGMVIDIFGDINLSGSGQPWDYLDGWAYRFNNTGPDASFFQLSNWSFSGINALDNQTTNATAPIPFPINTYSGNQGGVCANDFHSVIVQINDIEPPVINCPTNITVTLQAGLCETAVQLSGVTAVDNCDFSPDITQIGGIPFGSYFPIGNNTVVMQATDDLGNSSTCTFDVVVLEFPNPSQTLACNTVVHLTIGEFGTTYVNADMILEGGPYGCYDDYLVTITNEMGFEFSNWLTCDEVGQYLIAKVMDPDNGNSCWGQIILEDKTAPTILCQDWTIPCTQAVDAVDEPLFFDNCDLFPVLELAGVTQIDINACDDNKVTFQRTWFATDEYGNTSAPCIEIITVERPQVVDFPSDIVWQCNQFASRPNIINASRLRSNITDVDPATLIIEVNPTLIGSQLSGTGSGIPANIDGEWCKYNVTYSDEKIFPCGDNITGVFEIIRTWTVIDWCTGDIIISGMGGEDNVQVIKVEDSLPPNITASNIQVNANIAGAHPLPCSATEIPLSALASDNCSGIADIHLSVVHPIAVEIVNGQIPAPGLPINTPSQLYYVVTIQAFDNCGNVATKDVLLTVIDGIAPTPICVEITDVNLESTGKAEVFADAFNLASSDNCCLDKFEVRRMDDDPCDDGHFDLEFGPSVYFCCEDVGKTITVVFRAFDCFGNYNDCMVQVMVNDKLFPVLVSCPPSQRISCDWFADNIETQVASLPTAAEKSQYLDQVFGTPTFYDNCGLTVNRTYSSNLDQCLEGSIIRSFTATDGAGNTTVQPCSQTIFVDHVSDWAVEFPADITVNCGTTPPDFGEPKIFYETCELVAITYDDDLLTVVPDACYKIVRNWTLINWCVVGTNPGIIDQEVVEQPENQLGLPFPQCDVDGDGDCDGRTFRDSWRSGLPSNLRRPTVLDANRNLYPDTDLDTDPWDGYITYQQVIKVIDIVDPVFVAGCTIPKVCIEDNTCAVALTLPTPEVSDCSPDVTISAEINLGGVWMNGFGPFPNVPPGTYEVVYTAMDNCNNQTVCNTTVMVKDCKKPTPYCKTGIVVTLMNTVPPMIDVWASDLDDNSFDNCDTDLTFSFSPDTTKTSITFTCTNQNSTTFVDVWVTDDCGNQDFCSTFITVQDNAQGCADPLINLTGLVTNEDEEGIENVEIHLSGNSADMVQTDASGMYQFSGLVPGGDYSVVPVKDDNPLNGVTTFDLVLISKHILGVTLLDSPYKIIAADANKSGSVTTFDMVEIRKLILFITDDFQNNTSWRFVDKDFLFPNPMNPWASQFPELFNVNNVTDDQLNTDFIGIKVGDVNGSAVVNSYNDSSEDRTDGGDFKFKVNDQLLEVGQTVTIPFIANGVELSGFQFTLDFDADKLEFTDLDGGIVSEENFGYKMLANGAITASWNRPDGTSNAFEGQVFALTFKVKAKGQLHEMLSISSRYTKAEAYSKDLERTGVSLEFENSGKNHFGAALYQNTPNPFSDKTEIGFYLPQATDSRLTFTDVSGRTLKVVEGSFSAGYNKISLKRTELSTTGVVYYRLETTDYTATRMMMLMD